MLCISAGYAVMRCLSVRLSVCHVRGSCHKKLCCRKEAARCFVSVQLLYTRMVWLPDGEKNSNIWLFVLIWSTNVKKSPFSRTAAHIFVSPRDAFTTIAQYVAWMKRQFNACQTPRSIYPSIFNSSRCLSQCVSPKIAIFTTCLFPLGTPLGQSR